MAARLSEVDYIIDGNGCWIWQLCRTRDNGYGRKSVGPGTHVAAHRWYWEQANGPLTDGLELDHLCRVRACVNPAHLEPVTHAENCQRGATAKLDWDKARFIRASSLSASALAARFGVTKVSIYNVRHHKTWQEA